ncbi:hypothetical protein J6590_080282 [Homalodisca vitripennis]|nr:hypothetical protein J6590_091959 [Homalodisca vitripennis]KAG8309641.1 hypothetical protein J6590_080282 [Homalodisca vitripennis]
MEAKRRYSTARTLQVAFQFGGADRAEATDISALRIGRERVLNGEHIPLLYPFMWVSFVTYCIVFINTIRRGGRINLYKNKEHKEINRRERKGFKQTQKIIGVQSRLCHCTGCQSRAQITSMRITIAHHTSTGYSRILAAYGAEARRYRRLLLVLLSRGHNVSRYPRAVLGV